jgi:hypothetical protein
VTDRAKALAKLVYDMRTAQRRFASHGDNGEELLVIEETVDAACELTLNPEGYIWEDCRTDKAA